MSETEKWRPRRNLARLIGGILCLAVATPGVSPACGDEPLATPLETSNYSRPSNSAEVSSYLASLAARCPRARVETLGTSVLGRPLEALVLTGVNGAKVADADRVTVEIVGSQHGMEGAGTESLLAIARELLVGDLRHVLDDIDVVLVPNSNPDGFEINKRVNANGVNLNTDFVALSQPESIALVQALDRYQPEVVLDVHESAVLKKNSLALEGYMTNFMAQFEIANNPNISRSLRSFALNDVLTPWIAGVDAAGFNAHRYFGEIRSSRQAVTNGGLSLQNFRNRTGIEGRLSFLMETRLDPKVGDYPTYRNLGARVARQRISIERFLSVVHDRRDEILTALANCAASRQPRAAAPRCAVCRRCGRQTGGDRFAADQRRRAREDRICRFPHGGDPSAADDAVRLCGPCPSGGDRRTFGSAGNSLREAGRPPQGTSHRICHAAGEGQVSGDGRRGSHGSRQRRDQRRARSRRRAHDSTAIAGWGFVGRSRSAARPAGGADVRAAVE